MTDRGESIGNARPCIRRDWWPFLLCLVPGIGIGWLMVQYAVNVPFWDNWNILIYSEAEGVRVLHCWGLVNEHRVFIPQVVRLLLGWASNFNILLWVWAKLPAVVGLTAVEYLIFRHRASRIEAWLMVPWLSAFNFSLVYWPLWIDPRPLGSHLALLGFLVGLWALTVLPRGWKAVALAAAGAVLSSLSFFSGNMTWIILAGVLWLVGYRQRRFYLAWGIGALAVLVPYAVDLVKIDSPLKTAPTAAFGEIVRYLLVFIGSPLTATHNARGEGVATWLGLLGLLAAVVTIALVIRYIDDGFRRSLPWVSLMVWVGLAGAAAGAGRASIGLHQALARRYVNTSSGFWIAVVALCVVALWGNRTPLCGRWTGRAATVLPVLIMVSIAVLAVRANVAAVTGPRLTRFSEKLERGRQCLQEYETAEDQCLTVLHPKPEVVRTVMDWVAPSQPSFLREPGG